MGQIFGDLSYSGYVPQYQGLPLEEVEALGETLDTRFRQNLATQDALEMSINNLEVRDINRPHVQQALENAKTQLAEIRDRGNWEDAGLKVQAATKEFNMDMKVKGALKDKAAYDAWSQQLEKRYLEGDVDKERYDAARAYSMKRNMNQVSYDPETGEYKNVFSGYNPMNYEDIQKAMFDLGEKWKASSNPVTLQYKDKDGNVKNTEVLYDPRMKGYKIVGTEEYLTEAELQAGLSQAVMANPKYRAFINEGLMFQKDARFGKYDPTTGKVVGPSDYVVEVKDLFSKDAGDGALLNMTEDEAKKFIKENTGYDPDKVFADPVMREALYDQIYKMKAINSYVNPAAQAYSYKKEQHKYLTDHVLMESIKHANRMRVEKFKADQRWKIHKDGQAFKLRTERPISVENEGVVTPGKTTNFNKLKKDLSANKALLKQVQAKIKKAKETGEGDYASLVREQEQLQHAIAAQEHLSKGAQKAYMQSGEGSAFVEKAWAKLEKLRKQKGIDQVPFESKADFIAYLKGEKDVELQGKWTMFGTGRTDEQRAFNSIISEAYKERERFNYHYNKYANENEIPGITGNVLMSDKDGVQAAVSETLTKFVLQNGTNYTMAAGTNLATFLNKMAADHGEENLKITVAMNSGNQVGGKFPQTMTIIDKKTGKRIHEGPIYPHSGGADIRSTTGAGMMAENPKDSKAYQTGKWLVASAEIMSWDTNLVEDQTASVTDLDGEGAQVDSEPFVYNNNTYKIRKARVPVYNNKGEKVVNTRFEVVSLDENGNELPVKLVNPNYKDGWIDLNTELQNGDYSNTDRNSIQQQQRYFASFANQRDAMVALYDVHNPNGPTQLTNVTGFSNYNYDYEKQ